MTELILLNAVSNNKFINYLYYMQQLLLISNHMYLNVVIL
jgi:hypothetical protein